MQADYLWRVRALQRAAGVTEAQIRAIERTEEAAQLPSGDDLWRAQILQVRPTEDLDDLAATGLEQLLRIVDRDWLREQSEKPYRLGTSFLTNPLHIINGVRVGMAPEEVGPQRFARMLLVCQDHLRKRADFDFFTASTFVPEVAALGNSLNEIGALGEEAHDKFKRLGTMPDDSVTSTIFELLVGAACIRRGLAVQMVPETRSEKVPDFRVTGLGAITGAIECKRRLGLTTYELTEAKHVESLYRTVRFALKDSGIHGSIEASFSIELSAVSSADFLRHVLAAVSTHKDRDAVITDWGSLAFRRLPYYDNLHRTRLYSPDFLHRALTGMYFKTNGTESYVRSIHRLVFSCDRSERLSV